jgi:hypothetical protein
MEDNNSPEWSHKVAEEQSTENNFERWISNNQILNIFINECLNLKLPFLANYT